MPPPDGDSETPVVSKGQFAGHVPAASLMRQRWIGHGCADWRRADQHLHRDSSPMAFIHSMAWFVSALIR